MYTVQQVPGVEGKLPHIGYRAGWVTDAIVQVVAVFVYSDDYELSGIFAARESCECI